MIAFTDKKSKILILGISIIFILINSLLITKDIYWGLFTPLVIAIGLLYIYALDKVLLLISFLTPLAINLNDTPLGIGVSLPTEPMLIMAMLLFIMRLLYDFHYDRRITRHPIFISILIYMGWMLLTSVTSEMPVVSIKYFLSQSWFIIPFYFLGVNLFEDFKTVKLYNKLYIFGFTIVIIYTIIRHSTYGFAEQQGHWVMDPFYNDHTAYGAALSFFMPVMVYFAFNKYTNQKYRIFNILLLVLFLVATVLSYGRASWIAIVGSLGIAIVMWLRIKFKYILTVFITIIVLFFSFQHQIIDTLERNKQDSSANFVEHIQSMTNISSDASNLERINRWQSAIRLFEERPFLGWGPGTYQFVYAPFQMAKERTIISTNSGDLGNAHSEYLGPLAQMGVFGMLSFILILVVSLYRGIKLYSKVEDKEVKGMVMVCVLGLSTYYANGILNNFLDTDKLALPFWSYLAILTALDVKYGNVKHESSQELIEEKA